MPVQQPVGQNELTGVACDVAHGVHQAGFGIHTNMSFHAEAPLAPLFAKEHLRVSCFVFVLGGCGSKNQGGVDCGARLERQTAMREVFINSAEDLLDHLVFLQPLSKSQDIDLSGRRPNS